MKRVRRRRRWPKLRMGRPRSRRGYDDSHELHIYEEEIVMRALMELGADRRRVSVREMVIAQPERFNRRYLGKVLKRLHKSYRLGRYPHRGFGKEMWAYSIKPTGVSQ